MIRKNLPVTTAKYLRRLTKIQHALQATHLDAAQSGNYACDNAAAPAQRSGQNLGPPVTSARQSGRFSWSSQASAATPKPTAFVKTAPQKPDANCHESL